MIVGIERLRVRRAGLARARRLNVLVNQVSPFIPVPWSIERFVENIAADRNRPIALMAHPLAPDAASGWWLKTAKADYIVHSADCRSVERREAVISHEIAHILLGHEPAGLAPAGSSLSPEVAARFMNRTAYSDELEHEAETLAMMMLSACHAVQPAQGETGVRLSHRLR